MGRTIPCVAVATVMLGCLFVERGAADQTRDEAKRPVTGAAFERSVRLPIIITREEIPLRSLLGQLAEQRTVAIYLDRRMDPSSLVDVALSANSLPDALVEVVEPLSAGVSVLADTLYVAPVETARTIRTLAMLRQEEVRYAPRVDARRKRVLLRRTSTEWPGVSEPRQILDAVADRYGLNIDGFEQVPHDLWPAGSIGSGNAAETFLLLLMPFELAFEWSPDLEGIRIVSVPDTIELCQSHRVRGMSPGEAIAIISETFPEMRAKVVRGDVEACGTVEEHEALPYLIGGRSLPKVQDPAQKPIQERRFTLKILRQPASALFRTFEAQGIEIEFDEAALQAAEIDLDEKISLELKQVTAEELFTAIGEELGLGFRLSARKVTLFPREK